MYHKKVMRSRLGYLTHRHSVGVLYDWIIMQLQPTEPDKAQHDFVHDNGNDMSHEVDMLQARI